MEGRGRNGANKDKGERRDDLAQSDTGSGATRGDDDSGRLRCESILVRAVFFPRRRGWNS